MLFRSELKGKIYYRAKITQTNGTVYYSNISLINNASLSNILVYPNPAKDYININLLSSTVNNQNLFITDFTGRVFAKYHLTSNQQVINIKALPNGIYLLNINGKEKIKLIKL